MSVNEVMWVVWTGDRIPYCRWTKGQSEMTKTPSWESFVDGWCEQGTNRRFQARRIMISVAARATLSNALRVYGLIDI